MRFFSRSAFSRFASPRRWRWAALVVASLALHWIALNWAAGNLRFAVSPQKVPAALRTEIVLAPRPVTVAPQPARATRPPRAVRPRKPAQAPAAATPVIAAPSPAAAPVVADANAAQSANANTDWPEPDAIPDIASLETGEPAGEPASVPGSQTAPAAGAEPAQPAAGARYAVEPPPSAQLRYDVTALRSGEAVYGHGTIDWHFDGRQYAIHGDAGILFFSVLTFTSQGHTDDFGIAPLLYTEKRLRKPSTETRFDREQKLISFSSSPKSYTVTGGEQDRASIIWQLAGIGRGDPQRFAPDARIPLFIAGVRDGETWNIRVIGEEAIDLGGDPVQTWHVSRAPRPGSRDQQIDIWLAPGQEWYPVRLRFTETNGDYLDMSLSGIAATDAPARTQ